MALEELYPCHGRITIFSTTLEEQKKHLKNPCQNAPGMHQIATIKDFSMEHVPECP